MAQTEESNIPIPLSDSLLNLVELYVNTYKEQPEEFLKVLVNTTVPLEVTTMVYNSTLNVGDIVSIEDIEPEMKNKLWNQAVMLSDNKNVRVKLCKAIWLINFILEK